jgi:integrase
MATLIVKDKGKTPGYSIEWRDRNGQRRSSYLGGSRYTQKTAEEFKMIVEKIRFYQWNNSEITDKKTATWLQTAPPELLSKLEKADLIIVPKPQDLQWLWDTFISYRTDVKSSTMKLYLACRRLFFQTFLPTELVETITTEKLLNWKAILLTRYAAGGVATQLTIVNAMFNWAVRMEFLSKNPMFGIPFGSRVNQNTRRHITVGEYMKLLEACPSLEWRVIIALARFGGLRCPSELMQLRWSDIVWKLHGFWVRSPKTEHHSGHECRFVPLFSEIWTELKQLHEQIQPKDDDFIIQSFQGKSQWNLNSPFQKIARQAGLEKIVSPFRNMRKDRCNEVREQYGSEKETTWMGHSEKVMKKHYLDVTEKDYSDVVKLND